MAGGHVWWGHAWQEDVCGRGPCVAKGVCVARGHAWQGGYHARRGPAWHTVNERAVGILLECILVVTYIPAILIIVHRRYKLIFFL